MHTKLFNGIIPKNQLKLAILLVVAVVAFTGIGLSVRVPAYAVNQPIPAGCPGSTAAGPAAPGVCGDIPAGCPGSTQQGPKAPGTTCPYSGNTESTSGCTGGTCADPASKPDALCTKDDCDFIGKYINPAVNLLTIIFSLIAVISIIFAGIQYSASGGDPQKITQAKQRIVKTIVAIAAYFLLYAFMQFIVPGGVFKTT